MTGISNLSPKVFVFVSRYRVKRLFRNGGLENGQKVKGLVAMNLLKLGFFLQELIKWHMKIDFQKNNYFLQVLLLEDLFWKWKKLFSRFVFVRSPLNGHFCEKISFYFFMNFAVLPKMIWRSLISLNNISWGMSK